MTALIERIKAEPALVGAFVAAAVGLAVAFGLPLTDVQQAAIFGFSTAVTAFIVRSQVSPTETYQAKHKA